MALKKNKNINFFRPFKQIDNHREQHTYSISMNEINKQANCGDYNVSFFASEYLVTDNWDLKDVIKERIFSRKKLLN